jgi:hypothetical protein
MKPPSSSASAGYALDAVVEYLMSNGPHPPEVERALRRLNEKAFRLRQRREARRALKTTFLQGKTNINSRQRSAI